MANINKNIIMQAGAAVANAANKATGLPASTPEPGSIISVIQLVNGGRTIGPDALAHFTESVRNKLLSLLVSMEPIQDFNGYGHPWPAGGGNNKLPPASVIGEQVVGDVTFTSFADGHYHIKKTAGSTERTYKFMLAEPVDVQSGMYLVPLSAERTGNVIMGLLDASNNIIKEVYLGNTSPSAISTTATATKFYIYVAGVVDSIDADVYPMLASSVLTSYSPYSNICPISGRTGLDVYAGPTSAIGDAATYSMGWTSPAGTVYAGSADIVTGDIKAAPYYASYNGETLVGPWVSSMDEYDPQGTPTTGAQVVDLGGTMTEYHITGQDIITLVGDNYIWSDSGDVTITE